MAGEEKTTFTQEEVEARIAQEVAGLKESQKQLLNEAKQAKERLKNYDGVDAEEFRALKKAAQDAEEKKLKGEGDWKALEQQLVKKYEGQLEQEKGVSARYRNAVEKYLIDSAAATELAKVSDSPKLLLPHIRSRMKVVESDGEFSARIVDENGQVRVGKGQGSTPMTLSELIEEMKQDKEFALAFRGSGSSGGGASKSTGGAGGGSGRTISRSELFQGNNLQRAARGEIEVVN